MEPIDTYAAPPVLIADGPYADDRWGPTEASTLAYDCDWSTGKPAATYRATGEFSVRDGITYRVWRLNTTSTDG